MQKRATEMLLIRYNIQHLRASWRSGCILLSVSHCMTGLVQFHNCITRQIRKQIVRHWHSLCCIAWQPGLVSQVTVMQRSHSPRKTSLVVNCHRQWHVGDRWKPMPPKYNSFYPVSSSKRLVSLFDHEFFCPFEHFIAFQFVIRLCFLSFSMC